MMRSAEQKGAARFKRHCAGCLRCSGELNRDANQLIAWMTSLPDEVSCLIVRGGHQKCCCDFPAPHFNPATRIERDDPAVCAKASGKSVSR